MILYNFFDNTAKRTVNKTTRTNSKKISKFFYVFWKNRLSIHYFIAVSIFWLYFVPSEAGIACLSNPCLYGLCVDDVNSSYSCYCADGFTGSNCQTDWDECWSQPCLNGGECYDLVASYNCSCPEGFSGQSCEFDRDECLSQPCFNNATCLDGSNGFECHCLPGYTGSFCEWDVSVCNATGSERCMHGGACVEGPGEHFWCVCTAGWRGVVCEEPLDPCLLLQPCLHGGLCLSRGQDYVCACPFGFTGLRCENELTLCALNPCLNGAICVEEGSESVCYCVPDFHGDLCQSQYDECLLPPTPSCNNGGTCIDGVDGFTCSCPPDVTGKFCECPIGFDCTNHTYHPVLSPLPSTPTPPSTRPPHTTVGVHPRPSPHPSPAVELTTSPTAETVSQVTQLSSVFSLTTLYAKPTEAAVSEKDFTDTQEALTTLSSDTELHVSTSITDSDSKFPYPESTEGSSFTVSYSFPSPQFTSEIPYPKSSPMYPLTFLQSSSEVPTTSSDTKVAATSQPLLSSTEHSDEDQTESATLGLSTRSTPSHFVETSPQLLPTQETDTDVTETITLEPDKMVTTQTSKITTKELKKPTFDTSVTYVAITTPAYTDESSDEDESHPSTEEKVSKPDLESVTAETGTDVTTGGDLDMTAAPTMLVVATSETEDAERTPQGLLPEESSLQPTSATELQTRTGEEEEHGTKTEHSTTEMDTRYPDTKTTTATHLSKLPYTDVFLEASSLRPAFEEVTRGTLDSDAAQGPVTKLFISSTVTPEESQTPKSVSEEEEEDTTSPESSPDARLSTTGPDGVDMATKHPGSQTVATPHADTSQVYPTWESYTEMTLVTTVMRDPHEPTTCEGKSPCLNGGTCLSYNTGVQCQCPLQFSGAACERISNMTEVSLLPSSWLLFRVLTPAEGEGLAVTHRLEATIRVVSEEGVVFTLAEAEEGLVSGYHMQMAVSRGRLRLQFSCGLQSVRFSESKQRIDTGYPTRISASLSVWSGNESMPHVGRCRAELRLNNSLAVSGEQLRPLSVPRRHAALAHLVFGAWPRGRQATRSSKPEELEEEVEGVGAAAPGVVACISAVRVNERARLLLADVTAGSSDVVECVQLACLSGPCLHGGTCEETAAGAWSCRCPSGRLGVQCETTVCANNPCEGGATCLVHPGTNFVCLCPLGRQGVFCEQELEVTHPCLSPALVGVSPYLAVPLATRHASFRHGMELGLRFTPARTHQVAVLAYLGHGPRDHMALSYVHGRVMLTWDLGSGPRRVFTAREFPAGAEHEVRVGRSGREGWLRVRGDNGTHSGHSAGKMTQLNTRPILFIGGFRRGNTSLLPHDLPKHSGFDGCLSHFEIKTGSSQVTRYFPPGPPASPMRGRAVSQLGEQVCASSPCLNRGICLPHGPSFTCLCAQGWFGALCAEPRNPCDAQSSLCADGSTCVPLERGYECDCPLGRTGPFCRAVEARGSAVWPEVFFSGRRSFLEVSRTPPPGAEPAGLEHSCVEFEMKPASPHATTSTPAAQLLFFSRDPHSRDYMALLLTAERALHLLLGSGEGTPMSLRSPRGTQVRPGSWVRIRAGRVGRRVFLSVSGRPVSNWLLPGQAGDWSGGTAPLFIGGAPDLSVVSPLTWSLVRPFAGCIRRLHVDWRKVLVHLGRAKPVTRGTPRGPSSVEEPIMAQLTPEYMRQVQLSENWSLSSLGDDLTSLLQHESLAAYVSAHRQYVQDRNPKSQGGLYNLRQKGDSVWKTEPAEPKPASLPPQPSSEAPLEGSATPSVSLLSRSLRSRDALFASAARNVRPCDKSAPALLQVETCGEGEEQQVEECRSQQYQHSPSLGVIPGFRGRGWLKIHVPGVPVSLQPEAVPLSFLQLRFSASKPDGLIMWAQQEDAGFVGVGLTAGRLSVVWGGQARTNTALLSSSLADNEFHSVSVLWDLEGAGEGKEAHVWVDGEVGEVEIERRRRKRHHDALHTSTPPLTIFIGGFPGSRSVAAATLGHFNSSLHGCVAELAWDDESALLAEFASYPHNSVVPCSTT